MIVQKTWLFGAALLFVQQAFAVGSITTEEFAPVDLRAPALPKISGVDPVTPPALREPDAVWVEATLAGMTLDEKIGQMLMPTWGGSAATQLSTYNVGGFIFLAQPAATILGATNGLQAAAEVPLLFSIDCEAGSGARVGGGTRFPMNMALAATRNEDLATSQGIVTARECRSLGIHIGFGPVLDVNTEPLNPVIGIRSYSDDPELVARMAEAYVRGAESAGLLTTFKHFPGHGGTTTDSHETLPIMNITCDQLNDVHVAPYRALIGEGLGDLTMTAHVWYPCLDPGEHAKPATLSSAALTGILRDDLDYNRIIISDAFNMSGLQEASSTYEAVKISVLAGLDIVLMPASLADAFNGIKDAVTSGEITESRIDESVRRILRAKSRVGLPEAAIVDEADSDITLQHPDHLLAAGAVGRAALTSLHVDPQAVPIMPSQSVLVISLSASSQIFYLYGASVFTDAFTTQHSNTTLRTAATSIDSTEISDLVTEAKAYDRVIVTTRMWKPHDSADQIGLVQALVNEGVDPIYLSFGSPYHILDTPGLQNYYCGFSSHYTTQEWAARVLLGEAGAEGEWPVDPSSITKVEGWMLF